MNHFAPLACRLRPAAGCGALAQACSARARRPSGPQPGHHRHHAQPGRAGARARAAGAAGTAARRCSARPSTSWRWSIPSRSPTPKCSCACSACCRAAIRRRTRLPRAELARLVLERLISERAQLQLAKETGIKVDELTVDQAEQTVARQNQIDGAPSCAAASRPRASRASEFRNDLRNQLLLTRLRDREVESQGQGQRPRDRPVHPRAAARRPPRPRRRSTWRRCWWRCPRTPPRRRSPALQQKAQGIAQRARSRRGLRQAGARELSDAPDRASGGALGLRSADRYPPLFVEATQATPVGGIAGPVRSGAGFHVLKVLGQQPGRRCRRDGDADPGAPHPAAADAQRSTDAGGRRSWRNSSGASRPAGRFRAAWRASNSQDASAKDGGDLGWRRPGQFVPEFEEAIDAPGARPDQRAGGVALRRAPDPADGPARGQAEPGASSAKRRAPRCARSSWTRPTTTWAQEVRARAYVEFREPPQS